MSTVRLDYFGHERLQDTRFERESIAFASVGREFIYTYFVEQLLELFVLGYLKVYIRQEPSAKGVTSVTAVLEKLIRYMITSYDCPCLVY